MAYSIRMPDGTTVANIPDEMPFEEAKARIQKMNAPAPTGGVLGAIGAGTLGAVSGVRTGLGALLGNANEAAKAGEERQKEISERFTTDDSLAKIKEAYNAPNGGFLSAAKTAVGEIPSALAGAVPIMAEYGLPRIAGRVIGGALGTLAGPEGTIAGAELGSQLGGYAGLSLGYLSHIGSNVEEQAAKQAKENKPVDVNTARAAAFAVPETALDVAHLIPAGAKTVSKVFGPKVAGLLDRGLPKEAEQAAQERLAQEGFWKTIGKGTAEGAAVGVPLMVAQTALSRAQSGQELFSDDALAAYGSAATSGALGAPLGILGARGAQGEAVAAVEGRKREAQLAANKLQAEAEAQEAAKQEAFKQSPEYEQQVVDNYLALEKQRKDLEAQKIPLSADTPAADSLANSGIQKQIDALKPQITEAATEYNRLKGMREEAENKLGTISDQVGPITRDELQAKAPDLLEELEQKTADLDRDPTNSYTLQDIHELADNPESHAGLHDIIAERTGFDGKPIEAADLLASANDKKIRTDSEAFKDFLARITGTNDVNTMSQPQLHAAFKALNEIPDAVKPVAPVIEKQGVTPEELHAKLSPFLKKVGLGDMDLQIVKGMADEGSYVSKAIQVALDASNPMGVLRHETIHGLKDLGFFTDQQWRLLDNQAETKWVDQFLKQRNIDGLPLKAGEESRYDAYVKEYNGDMAKVREEAIADAFRHFDRNGAPSGVFSGLLNGMRNLFTRLKNAFNGAGFQTANDVFRKVEDGKLAQQAEAATGEARKSLIRKAVPGESEISTQNPQGVTRRYDPITDMLSIDTKAVQEAMQANPKLEGKMISAIKNYGFIPVGTADKDVLPLFKKNMISNLLHLYNKVPEAVRQRSKLWYDGANRLAIDFGKRYDLTKEQVSGIFAAMSPQKDWFQNVSMAERAIDILKFHGDKTWTPDMIRYAKSYIMETTDRAEREKRQAFFDNHIQPAMDKQTRLNNMGNEDAAAFVRAYDEAFHSRDYNIVTPEGGFGGKVMNNPDAKTGEVRPSTMMWSTYSPIEKTVSMFRDGSRENISHQLGEEHKIRSFYNNIVAPNSKISHVTIDTHAVAAALYEALAGTDTEVTHNFGGIGKSDVLGVGGTYGLIADAYREAAKRVGVLPREMQSITWEAVRGMFNDDIKKSIKQPIRDQWALYRTGKQSFDKTRSNIESLGRSAEKPDWVDSGKGNFVSDGGSSFDKSFTPEGGVRLRQENELIDKALVNLSATTESIPGIKELYKRAMTGDQQAYTLLQDVAASHLKHLLSGTGATVKSTGIKGVFDKDREPSIEATVRFKESDAPKVLAALGRFAENFNQYQVHVRLKTNFEAGHDFGDGSYATTVYKIPLKSELSEGQIKAIIAEHGLKGFSLSDKFLTAYHVEGKTRDLEDYKRFADQIIRVYKAVGDADEKVGKSVQRLFVYGHGDTARIGYDAIRGNVSPKANFDQVTPKLVANYLANADTTTFKPKKLTKADTEQQEHLANIFKDLPVNDLQNPLVREAYEALAKEVVRQYKVLPIKVTSERYAKKRGAPYGNVSDVMRRDVAENNALTTLRTDAKSFGPEGSDFTGHPLLEDSGLKDQNGKKMLYNDVLRAVHDYFAHNLSDATFGPQGEFAAWKNHMATTADPLARWALTSETRGQNAWQNFRPEAKNVKLKDRPYADQKAALVPATFALTGDAKVDASMHDLINRLSAKDRIGSVGEDHPMASGITQIPEARKSLRTAPDTPEFKQFFGDSKIVNEDGTPKVMYHGTASDVKVFKPKQAGAIFATEEPRLAHEYSETASGSKAFARNLEDYSPQELARAKAQAIADVKSSYGNTKEAASLVREIKSDKPTGEASDFLKMAADKLFPEADQNIMPVWVRAERPFDYENPEHIKALGLPDVTGKDLASNVARLESDRVQKAIKDAGFDSFYIKQGDHKNIAVYDPGQIKSAIGNSGKYDRFNPDVRASKRTVVSDTIQAMPNGQAILDSMNKVATTRDEKTYAQRITSAIAPDTFSKLRQAFVHKYNQMSVQDRRIAERMGGIDRLADQSAEAAALESDKASGIAAAALGVGNRMGGIPVFRNGFTTVSDENGTIKGAVAIFAPLAKYGDSKIYQAYQLWAGAKRAERLTKEDREKLFSAQDIANGKALEAMYPEFKDIQKEWIKYSDGLVKYMVDTGQITEEQGKRFTEHSDYLPFYRQVDGDSTVGPKIFQNIAGVKAPKNLKGGEAPLGDFMENIVRNTQAAIAGGLKNEAGRRAVQDAVTLGEAERLNAVSSAPDVVTILEKGMPVSYRVADPLLIDAMRSLSTPEMPLLGILSKPANFLRSMVTKDPAFIIANMMKHSMYSYMLSGSDIKPITGTIKNFADVMGNKSETYQKLLNAGVLSTAEFGRGIEASGKALEKSIGEKGGAPKTAMETAMSPVTGIWHYLEKASEAHDAAVRISVYEDVMKKTGNEAEALHRALEVLNFNRKGNNPVVRIITATVPFLNAKLQGLDIMYRSGIRPSLDPMSTNAEKLQQKTSLIRMGTLLGLSTMYAAAVMGNKEYENQNEEVRDLNWIIPGVGKFPIPFELGVLFKTIPEHIYRYYYGTDTAKDLQRVSQRALLDTLSFNPIPQAIMPALEAKANYSLFTQRPIVSAGMERLEPEYQMNAGTSKVAEQLGKLSGTSPMLIDHLLQGYTGTMGMYFADVADAVMNQYSDVKKPALPMEQMPIIKRFLVDPNAKGTTTAFYELKDEVDRAVATAGKLEKEGSEELPAFIQKHQKELSGKEYVNNIQQTLKEFTDAANAIRRAKGMTADEKRDKLAEITKAQNQMLSGVYQAKKMFSE